MCLHQKKKRDQDDQLAIHFNKEILLIKTFFNWINKLRDLQDLRIMQRMAIMECREKRLKKVWKIWIIKTRWILLESRKDARARIFYRNLLLQRSLRHIRHFVTINRVSDQQKMLANHHYRRLLLVTSWLPWRQLVERRKEKRALMSRCRHHYDDVIMKRYLLRWKKQLSRVISLTSIADEKLRLRHQKITQQSFHKWRLVTSQMKRSRELNEAANQHRDNRLTLKVFHEWQRWAKDHVIKKVQDEEEVEMAKILMKKIKIKMIFKIWRSKCQIVSKDRALMTSAVAHHSRKLLIASLQVLQYQRCLSMYKEMMKEQADEFVGCCRKRRIWKRWREQLGAKREEQTDARVALCYWALSVEMKMLLRWKKFVKMKKRMKERCEEASRSRRDQLLKIGCRMFLINRSSSSLVHKIAQHWLQKVRSRKQPKSGDLEPISIVQKAPINKSFTKSLPTLIPALTERPSPRLPEFLDSFLNQESPLNHSGDGDGKRMPSSVERMPSSVERMPSSFERMPPSFERMPPSVERMPSSVERMPSSVERMPSCVERMPSSFERMPSSFERMQAESQNFSETLHMSSPHSQLFCSALPTSTSLTSSSMTSQTFVVTPRSESDIREELLSIQLKMRSFQDRKDHLKRLKEEYGVLSKWLQTKSFSDHRDTEEELIKLNREIEELTEHLRKDLPEMERLAVRVRVLSSSG